MLASAVALVSALSRLSQPSYAGVGGVAGAHRDASASREVAGPAAAETTHRAVAAAEQWASVLARLDRRRAKAYATGDPALLRAVYVPGSAVLRRDQVMLARYVRRGLHIRGLRMHVADLRVGAVRPGLVVLRVRDRVAAGTVSGRGHRRPLPADDLDARLLTLRRVDRGVWLVGGVRPVPP
jgi:hypothetical protein